MKRFRNILSVIFTLALTAAMLCVSAPASAQDVTVTSIVAEDVNLYPESNGRWCSDHPDGISGGDDFVWFLYTVTPDLTVYYSDGSSVTVGFYEIYSLVGNSATVKTNQTKDTAWGIGEHTASVTCGDFTDEFTVTVLPSPVVSITAQSTTVRYFMDGNHSTKTLFLYTLNPILTVTFEDGSVITGTRGYIEEHCGYPAFTYVDSDQTTSGGWDVGDHTATIFFMGRRTDFNVTVIDVVSSIEVVTPPTNTSLLYGAYVDLRGSVLRVHFTDGNYEDISPINTHTNNAGYYVHAAQRSCMLDYGPLYVSESGEQEIVVSFLGKSTTFTVDVAPKPTALQLTSNEDDHSLSLTLNDGDSTKTYRILKFVSSGGAQNNDAIRTIGTLYTEGGLFLANLGKTYKGTTFIELGSTYYGGNGVFAASNAIEGTYWYEYYTDTLTYGDFDRNGELNTTDVREQLKALARSDNFNAIQINVCDINQDGEIGTADVRLMLKRVLAK